jgi:rhodanese-related sulfurtransferase
MTPKELQSQVADGENIVIVDCRTPEEQDVSMIPGAVRRVDLEIEGKKDAKLVCYWCAPHSTRPSAVSHRICMA